MSPSLTPTTGSWFSRQVGTPTPVQNETWAAADAGRHIMAVAPTGSGKTLAAFLVALDKLFSGKLPCGSLSVLYISPLKALGADIRENLTGPLRELKESFGDDAPDIRIGIRNGDTTPSERRRQISRPPEILVSTPESLNILLLSEGGRELLSTIRICILDEIHAIAPSRRGTLLAFAMERLVDLAGEFQRIGLTATVRPVERAAAYLGGFQPSKKRDPVPRDVTIIAPPISKEIRIRLEKLPAPGDSDRPDPDGFWRDIARRMKVGIRENRSTLAFIDSRKWSEKLARLINEGEEEPLAWAHHGSLSKDMRRLVENRLKQGQLKAVVATGSLELGIDIGPLDEVILLGTPSSPSAALQRAGRAGHKPGIRSQATIYPITRGDLLAGTVLAKMAEEGEIEEIRIPENPLDILAQSILALCTERGRQIEEIWKLLRRVWSFRNLPRASFESVLAMLRGRYADTRLSSLKPRLYMEENRLVSRPGTRILLYTGGGAIPDLGMYSVREGGAGPILGSLDEKFVWESQAGAVFHLGNRRWRIIGINDKEVSVVPTDEAVTTEPFWRADGRNRDEEYARRIAGLLEDADSILGGPGKRGLLLEDFLVSEWNLEQEQAAELATYLQTQYRRCGGYLPHRHRLVAEAASDPQTGGEPGSRTLFLHTMFGGRVNRPLALALQAAWAERNPVPAIPTVSDESIAFTLAENDIEEFVGLLQSMANPEILIRKVLEATPFFGGRFREAAGRALLLPASSPRRRQPLWMTRQRARMLLESVSVYPDFPLLIEVWRSCLNDEFSMEALGRLLDEIRGGEIRIDTCFTPAPSPFADSAVRRRLSRRMTANMRDQSDARFVSRVDSEEIRRLSRAGALRPRIPRKLTDRLDIRRRRLEPGYAPGSPEALKAWIAEREAFDIKDWKLTIEACAHETGTAAGLLESDVSVMIKEVQLGPNQSTWMISAERSDEWIEAFGTGNNSESQTALISFWLTGRGPVGVSDLLRLFGYEEQSPAAEDLVERLSGTGESDIIADLISEDEGGDGEIEFSDKEGLEILLRWRRRQARNADAPLQISRLAPFLAIHQGLTSEENGVDALISVSSRLEGFPGAAAAWETSIFPSRIPGYRPSDLDDLVNREELIWVGAGEKRITFLSAQGGWRYPPPSSDGPAWVEERAQAFPAPGDPPRGFWEIADALGTDSAGAVEAIWNRVWSGHLTTDDAGILRRAASTGFKAAPPTGGGRRSTGGLRGWKAGRPVDGRWYAPSYSEEPEDPMVADRLMRERIRLLLRRYGLLSRPLLEREIPPWRWQSLSRTLNLMELGDELIGGRWFDGLPMPQFLAPESLVRWRDGADPGRGWCIDATDPASPCGIGESGNLPPRREGTWLAWSDSGELLLSVQPGRMNIDLQIPSDSERMADTLNHLASLLTERPVSPLSRLKIRTVNGEDVTGGPAVRFLEKTDFHPAGNGDWVRRPRPIGLR